MRTVLKLLVVAFLILPFAGCYTELATVEQSDRSAAYNSETVDEDGNTTINNHYYLDDDYRRSRLRVSFHYYYPTYSSWIGSYYNSYFNDYYWGMYHRPSWYYDPLLTYYPPYGWPYPYYDPWYPYYHPVVYYPAYYPVYYPTAGNPVAPLDERRRNGGSTHITDVSGDTRNPIPQTPPAQPPVITTEAPRPKPDTEATEKEGKRGSDVPWWDRLNAELPKNNTDARPIETVKGSKPPADQRPVTPPSEGRPTPSGENRPVDRPKHNPPSYTPPSRDDRPVERPKENKPVYTPPSRKPSGNDEARPVERPRETRQPSYTPPPQSPPPQSTPPRSSGGSSSGGNGKRRD